MTARGTDCCVGAVIAFRPSSPLFGREGGVGIPAEKLIRDARPAHAAGRNFGRNFGFFLRKIDYTTGTRDGRCPSGQAAEAGTYIHIP